MDYVALKPQIFSPRATGAIYHLQQRSLFLREVRSTIASISRARISHLDRIAEWRASAATNAENIREARRTTLRFSVLAFPVRIRGQKIGSSISIDFETYVAGVVLRSRRSALCVATQTTLEERKYVESCNSVSSRSVSDKRGILFSQLPSRKSRGIFEGHT